MRVMLGLATAALAACGCGGAGRSDGGGAGTDAGGAATDGGGATDGSAPGSDGGGGAFVPVGVNVPSGYLCDIPPDYVAMGGDPTYVDCDVESDDTLSDRDPATVPASLLVVAWNVEFGNASATVLSELETNPDVAGADVLLLSEVARYNLASNPPMIDQARDLAVALAMNYVFAVEWDRREDPAELGEHGVAILSKYPLGNVTQIRHTPVNDWYAETMHYGGRISLGADALVGGVPMRLYVSHLDTRGADGGRAMQAAETRADADLPGRPALEVVGGDMNTWTCNPAIADCTMAPAAEQLVEDYLAAGWSDGCAGWNGVTELGAGIFPQRLDWLFYRGGPATPGMAAASASGSDHDPIWFRPSPP
jgi:endonuclease/exonuclease/phosphatase family metal-dependent hydrolase